MNQRLAGRKKRFGIKLITGGCFIAAALLLAAAFMQGEKQNSAAGWVPMNEAVEEKLEELKAESEPEAQEAVPDAMADGRSEAEEVNQADGVLEKEQPGADAQPVSNEEAVSSGAEGGALTSRDEAGRLDVNRATAAELDGLKGIGPSKAQAIVEDRERNGFFASVDDLLRVKGIGEKLLAGIKDSVVTRP